MGSSPETAAATPRLFQLRDFQHPMWLDLAHQKLDQAVFAAYRWEPAISEEYLLAALLELNLQRTASES